MRAKRGNEEGKEEEEQGRGKVSPDDWREKQEKETRMGRREKEEVASRG